VRTEILRTQAVRPTFRMTISQVIFVNIRMCKPRNWTSSRIMCLSLSRAGCPVC
jgi:hypothetical protein